MDKNINHYYEKYQESLIHLQDDPENNDVKAEVTEAFKQVFHLIKMFMIIKKERYYGYFLMNLEVQINYALRYPAGVSVDTNPFTLKINPLLMGCYPIKGIIFIICHEIEHLVLNHPAEGLRLNKEKDPRKHMLINIAMDASVNDILLKDIEKHNIGIMVCPDDAITSKVLGEICGSRLSSLREFTYYYRYIPEDIVQVVEVMRKDAHDWTENDSAEDIEAAIRLFVEESVKDISDEDLAKLPAHQRELIRKLLSPPKIKWQNVLKKYIGTLPDGYRKTKTRLNRRQPERYDISSRARSRTVRIVVAVDTSGSMTRNILEDIFIEIFALLKHVRHEITVIECDCAVQNVYTASSLKDVNLDIKGRGFTSYVPVIEYINKENRFRDALLVYFTDGIGDLCIPRPHTLRNLWIITGGGKLSMREPFGKVIEMI